MLLHFTWFNSGVMRCATFHSHESLSHHIRVYPDVTLKTVRGELRTLLGAERNMDKFSFLKCVGRSLALVEAAAHSPWFFSSFLSLYSFQSVRRGEQRHTIQMVWLTSSPFRQRGVKSVSEKRKKRPLLLPWLFFSCRSKANRRATWKWKHLLLHM